MVDGTMRSNARFEYTSKSSFKEGPSTEGTSQFRVRKWEKIKKRDDGGTPCTGGGGGRSDRDLSTSTVSNVLSV